MIVYKWCIATCSSNTNTHTSALILSMWESTHESCFQLTWLAQYTACPFLCCLSTFCREHWHQRWQRRMCWAHLAVILHSTELFWAGNKESKETSWVVFNTHIRTYTHVHREGHMDKVPCKQPTCVVKAYNICHNNHNDVELIFTLAHPCGTVRVAVGWLTHTYTHHT